MTTYQSIDEVVTDFGDAMTDETAAAFRQGKIIAAAIESGLKAREVVRACASHTRMKSRTVYNRLKVYRTFGDDWNPQVGITMHLLAANTDDPHGWLAKAVDENMSTRQLENAIGNRPQVYLKNVEAELVDVYQSEECDPDQWYVTLLLQPISKDVLPELQTIGLITLVQANAQEANAA
jgi:hypothetical protein